MPIDKLTPRQLDADSDSKLVKKTSMLDALNLYSGDTGGSGGDGDMGVLKNIKGNLAVDAGQNIGTNARIIGKVEDKRTNLVYLFVYSAIAAQQGVWAYDPLGRLPGSVENSLRLIYKSKQFNFPQDGFVKGDIVYSNARSEEVAESAFGSMGVDFEKDAIIYFTDGVNEPRKINAYRAFLAGGSEIHGSEDTYAEADFITACPKTPLEPITFIFDAAPSRAINNFVGTPGFQFAYQYLYKDGMETAISCYSEIAIPPTVINQGAQTYIGHEANNRCLLTVPLPGPEIDSIRLVGRQGNTGSFLVIDEFKSDGFNGDYEFFNDRILTGVSTDEVNKQFDSIPRKATAQTTSSNRLMYGGYTDGFDNVDTQGTATAIYHERGEDFKTFDIKISPSIGLLKNRVVNAQNSTTAHAKTTGFVMDCTGLPSSITEGTIIDFNLTISPDQNWHIYQFLTDSNDDPLSYHQSMDIGPREKESIDPYHSGLNAGNGVWEQTPKAAGALYVKHTGVGSTGFMKYFGGGFFQDDQVRVSDKVLCGWESVHPGTAPGASLINPGYIPGVRYGTSAGNPLILQGGVITFSAKVRVTSDIASDGEEAVKDVLVKCLTGIPEGLSADGVNLMLTAESLPFQIVEDAQGEPILQNKPSYNIDLGLNSGDSINQRMYGAATPEHVCHPFANLIVGVGQENETPGIGPISTFKRIPLGYFIVNKAKPTFRAEVADETNTGEEDYTSGFDFFYNNPKKAHIRIGVDRIENVETHTCIHAIANDFNTHYAFDGEEPGIAYEPWIVISKSDLLEEGFDLAQWLPDNNYYGDQSKELKILAGKTFITTTSGHVAFNAQVGYLKLGGATAAENDLAFFNQPADEPLKYCLMDGEGGPGGGPSRGSGSIGGNDYDNNHLGGQGSITVNARDQGEASEDWLPAPTPRQYDYTRNVFHTGNIQTISYFAYSPNEPTTLPLIFDADNYIFRGTSEDEDSAQLNGVHLLTAASVNRKYLHSFSEILTSTFSTTSTEASRVKSFKTEANHDFGVIYYDERGRHGFVNPIASVFIEGYSSTERGADNQGPVSVELNIDSTPPSWAHYYKIAYGKNSSVKDFVQYSAGGAFVKSTNDEIADVEASESNKNIYVSLNHLQGHPISYVSDFGARTPEGGFNFYKFESGDKLRVISASDQNQRIYPIDIEFEVVGQVSLGGTDNPLAVEPEPSQEGEFVILKNNPSAYNFSFSSVTLGTDYWKNNCIFELRSPQKTIDTDKRLYYEIEGTYKVVRDEDDLLHHNPSTIELTQGDVWFRHVAVNVRELEDGNYVDLIPSSTAAEGEVAKSNFKSVYLETPTATDLARADSLSIGRPNVPLKAAAETIREATITYSDPSNPESKKVNYSSFNNSLANFKDLPEKYGGIQYIGDQGDSIFVLQQNKTSRVPVNRNILSDASGKDSLIASRDVLGKVVFYPGESGCGLDPSSVSDIEGAVFFANKSLGKIYRFDRDSGVKAVSDLKVAALFRNMFKDAVDGVGEFEGSDKHIRVVGGYDPVKEEYLITVLALPNKNTSGVVYVDQPSIGDDVVVPDDTDDDDDGGGGDSELGGMLVPDIDGDGVVTVDEIIEHLTSFGLSTEQIVDTSETLTGYVTEQIDTTLSSTTVDDLIGLALESGESIDDIIASSDALTAFVGDAVDANQGGSLTSASTSNLVSQLIAKITQVGNSPPYDSITYGELTSILNSVNTNQVGGTVVASALSSFYSDVNRDGMVNTQDLTTLLAVFATEPDADSDLNLTEAGDLDD